MRKDINHMSFPQAVDRTGQVARVENSFFSERFRTSRNDGEEKRSAGCHSRKRSAPACPVGRPGILQKARERLRTDAGQGRKKNRNDRLQVCKYALFFVLALSLFFPGRPVMAQVKTGINMTKHNLSVTGPGPIKALTETRICIFCHTPHNSTPRTPLWNRTVSAKSYELYQSSTMVAGVSQPSGPSRLCLSCHDGTIALGTVLHPSQGITVAGSIAPGLSTYIGSLASDHPISFSYYSATSDPQIMAVPPANLTLYGQGFIECSTCHDPHDDTYGKFLVMDNKGSALCVECHAMQGWDLCSHKNSVQTLPVPLPGLEWTHWSTVADYGCEGCHVMHNAGGPERLLRYPEEEKNCYDCHNGTVAQKNIYAQFQKASHHPVELTTGIHQPNEPPTSIISRHVECVDCHNPHSVNSSPPSQPNSGGVSGMTENVSGMDKNRNAAIPAVYEYQICFKCHADLNQTIPFIPRVVSNTNMQSAFDQSNQSYHPIEGSGVNLQVPSIPSPLLPTLAVSSIIKCTDCHADDDSASNGPHGSRYAPILRDEYETTMNTPESFQAYALCYRCHSRDSILRDDSFKKNTTTMTGGHSGHLAAGAPCSVCHDPHGIAMTPGTGDHTNLINFDTRYVSPVSGATYPTFTDTGTFSGSCTLICHTASGDVTHVNASYP
jgi:predicted CXXCH cytochrome family protein